MTYERSNIQSMAGYASGEQPDSPDVIKLNTNENPFPPGSGVADALAGISVDDLRRYPPPTAAPLRQTIAACHALDPDEVIVTNGGDELLRLVIDTFVEPGGRNGESIGVAEPSYSLYRVLAQAHGCTYHSFELAADWSLPADFADQLNRAGVKLCFVVNPHAPSGLLTPVQTLRRLAERFHGVLVIDEAYADFVDPDQGYDAMPLIREFDNVVILRTFSKGYSLAGLRMAYGLACPGLIAPMQYKTKDSYNTDFIAQTLATAALRHREEAAATWAFVRDERAALAARLRSLGLESAPSQSNFLLVTVPPPREARDCYLGLKEAGVLVRWFDQPRLRDKLRITIGRRDENDRLIAALTAILGVEGALSPPGAMKDGR